MSDIAEEIKSAADQLAPKEGGEGEPAPAPVADDTFYSKWGDEDLRKLVQDKGWSDPEAMAKSYKNLSSMRGVDDAELMRIPDNGEGINEVLDKLGRPKTADEYTFEGIEGASEDQIKAISELALEGRITPEFAGKLLERELAQGAGIAEAATAAEQLALNTSDAELNTKWGEDYEKNIAYASEAAVIAEEELGIGKEQFDKMSRGENHATFLQLMALVGQSRSEHKYLADKQGGRSLAPMGKDDARNRLNALKKDPAWQERRTSTDPLISKKAQEEIAPLYVQANQ